MGTSELYSAVEALPEVLDSMVVDLEYLGRESYMPLFVVLRPGHALDGTMKAKINDAIKIALSPRFVPNEILQVAEIPRTLTGKKQELPIKKLLLGQLWPRSSTRTPWLIQVVETEGGTLRGRASGKSLSTRSGTEPRPVSAPQWVHHGAHRPCCTSTSGSRPPWPPASAWSPGGTGPTA
jgi:hypothetical protein